MANTDTTTKTTIRFVTWGPVRGSDGTRHRTVGAAQRALEADRVGCGRQGGYSDRAIYAVDASGTRTLVEQD